MVPPLCRVTVVQLLHSGAAWYTMVLFLRRLWNRLHLAMHSGAVCYTGACFYVAYMLYVHMEPCENRLIDP